MSRWCVIHSMHTSILHCCKINFFLSVLINYTFKLIWSMYVKVQRQEISQLQYFHNSIPFKFPSSWTRKDLNALTHLHLQLLFSPDLESDQFDLRCPGYISLTQRCPEQQSVWLSAVPGSYQFDSTLSRAAISLTQLSRTGLTLWKFACESE